MKSRSLGFVLAAVLCAAGMAGVAQAARSPVQYLLSAQNRDGGFGPARGQASTQLYAGWAALGLAADGYNPATVARGGGLSLLDYIRAGVASISDPGSLERTILVARAAGQPASSFGGRNLIAELDRYIKRNGSVSNQTNLTAFAVLALRSAGIAPSVGTLRWLARQQDRDGGFNFETAGGASDVDDTGAALEALAGDGSARAVIGRAVRFIRRQQNRDAGFPSQAGASSNAQSTAFAVQGLIAVGVRLESMPHGSPDRYLRALTGISGAIAYARGTHLAPVWVTAEALMALAGKPLPLAPVGG
jgi:hypothetical protein